MVVEDPPPIVSVPTSREEPMVSLPVVYALGDGVSRGELRSARVGRVDGPSEISLHVDLHPLDVGYFAWVERVLRDPVGDPAPGAATPGTWHWARSI